MKKIFNYNGSAKPLCNWHKLLLIMKISAFLFFCGLFNLIASPGYSQNTKISLNMENSSIEAVLNKIEEVSDFYFFFNQKLIDVERKVDVVADNESISNILDEIFGNKVKVAVFGRQIILAPSSNDDSGIIGAMQQTGVSGTVTDAATGEAMAGVNIVVKGVSIGTITDVDGKYSLPVPDRNVTLVFSFIGYVNQEIPLNGRATLDVALSGDLTALEEVVVIGYGTKRLSELSSSVSVVNEQTLDKGVVSQNLGTMLQGKVPGLVVSNSSGHPQREANLVIRGVGSIGAGYTPLYVVDGVIGGSADPSDIESVTVLKDAAATGLYGSRAANGVILITTVSGQSGKTKINYSGSTGPSFHRNGNLELMNSAELYENRRQAGKNYYNNQVALGTPAFTGVSFDEYFEKVVPSSVLNTDSYWPSLLTRTGNINKHHLSITGGNDKTTFYIGGNYYSEKGTLVGEEFQRINLRTNLKHKISEKLTLTWRLNGGIEQFPNDPQTGQESVAVQYFINVPWDPVYEADGMTPYNPYKSGYWYSNNKANYFYDSKHYTDRTKELNTNTDLQLEVRITDWMSFSTTNRFGISGSDWKQLLDNKYFASDFEKGRLSQNYSYSNSILTSNLLKMNHSIADHNFNFMLGQEYSYNKYLNTSAVGVDIPVGLSALSATATPKTVSGSESETGFLSYFGQMDYNYDYRYFLVGSIRCDASSRFGANNRWATFYSIGGSWIASNENFLKGVSWIDQLKIRSSYGTTGNANISNYLSLGTYGFSLSNTYDGLSGARPSRLANDDLTWETAYSFNVGLELSILKRIRLELDFYNRTNKDLLQSVPLPATSGFSSQQRNVGSVRNRGVDLNLTTVNLNGEFRWETNLNLNINKNKVLALNQGKDIASGAMRIREGLPLRYFYMKEWAGVDVQTGDPLWVRWEDENGKIINGADKKEPTNILTTNNYNLASNLFIGPSYPDFTGGITNDFYYKNFSLSVLANFVVGQTIYFSQRFALDDDGTVTSKNQMKPYKDWVTWENPGDVATHPRLLLGGNKNSNQASSRYLEDASYFRIQNVTFSYTFPKVFGGLKLYTMVDNLAVLTKFSGLDPDINLESPESGQSIWGESYGASRKIILGVNIDF